MDPEDIAEGHRMADIAYPCFIARLDGRGRWHWTYYVREDEAIARSKEGYVQKEDCERSIRQIQESPVHAVHFIGM